MRQVALYSLWWFGTLVLGGMFVHFPGWLIRLDLVLLLVLYLGFTAPLIKGGWTVFAIGVATEAVVSPVVGGLTLSYLMVFFLTQFLMSRFVLEGSMARAVWVLILVFVQKGVVAFFVNTSLLPLWVVGSAILQSLVSTIVFPSLAKAERWVQGEA